ncbi:hypothetical protein [Wenzhouxiangella marina]|uniref:hypothetical protein n=1 Tax=Wenzhouxiangella marina TaxID=1579979 RepID=UPI0006736DAD|nr:hypothetical protein [Wenzhouxiangella marina]MBB6088208.1 hypothetical protein [Wenzhouxiangella marina]
MERQLDADGELSPQARHLYSQWLEPCFRAVQIEGMSEAARTQLGLRGPVLAEAAEFCAEALPPGLDPADAIDATAMQSLSEDYLFEGSLFSTSDALQATSESISVDAASRDALNILGSSVDEGAMLAALDFLVTNEEVDPPYADYPATRFMYDPVLQGTVVTALLCDRIGGCYGQHPLTLRHCIASRHGCLAPSDYFDAVRQTTPPLEYEAFLSLYQQIHRRISQVRRP